MYVLVLCHILWLVRRMLALLGHKSLYLCVHVYACIYHTIYQTLQCRQLWSLLHPCTSEIFDLLSETKISQDTLSVWSSDRNPDKQLSASQSILLIREFCFNIQNSHHATIDSICHHSPVTLRRSAFFVLAFGPSSAYLPFFFKLILRTTIRFGSQLALCRINTMFVPPFTPN